MKANAEFVLYPELLPAVAERIHEANNKFRASFTKWIGTVGSELRGAQELLASHHAGFAKWIKAEFGWSLQRAHQLMDAEEIVRITSTMVDVVAIPSSERQCRELRRVPEGGLPKVWEQICKHAEKDKQPITAKLIREFTEPYRPPTPAATELERKRARAKEIRDLVESIEDMEVMQTEAIPVTPKALMDVVFLTAALHNLLAKPPIQVDYRMCSIAVQKLVEVVKKLTNQAGVEMAATAQGNTTD